MRRAINVLAWVTVSISIIFLLLTILTTSFFLRGNLLATHFNGYLTFQRSMVATMLFWSLKLFIFKNGSKDRIYALICLMIGAITVFFIVMRVK